MGKAESPTQNYNRGAVADSAAIRPYRANALITSDINRVSGYIVNNPTLAPQATMWGPKSAQDNPNRGAVAHPAAMCNSRLLDAEDVGVLLTRGYADAHPGLSASPQSARRHVLDGRSFIRVGLVGVTDVLSLVFPTTCLARWCMCVSVVKASRPRRAFFWGLWVGQNASRRRNASCFTRYVRMIISWREKCAFWAH